MKSIIPAALLALLLYTAAPSNSADEKPDFRQVNWGMTKDEVKKREKAEFVKDTGDMLIYKIEGGKWNEVFESDSPVKTENMRPAVVEIDIDLPDYSLFYIFSRGKLGMAVLSMNDPHATSGDYVDEFEARTDELIKEIGSNPESVVKLSQGETTESLLENPEGICEGKYAIQNVWPTINDKTDVMIELDQFRALPVGPKCNLSIFYESVKYPVDPARKEELHETL